MIVESLDTRRWLITGEDALSAASASRNRVMAALTDVSSSVSGVSVSVRDLVTGISDAVAISERIRARSANRRCSGEGAISSGASWNSSA